MRKIKSSNRRVQRFPVGAAVLDKASGEMAIVVAGFIEQRAGGRSLYVLSHYDGTLDSQYGEELEGCPTSALPEVKDLSGRDPLAAQRRVLDGGQAVREIMESMQRNLQQLASLAG
ncbi:MAG TPA: hypothetical protein VM008_01980 [Phycisphaerae bacterium]|nr:hypothetical protein [Phycisphaerae bacterium]